MADEHRLLDHQGFLKRNIMTNQLYQDNVSHMAPVWTRIFNFVADRAEGSYIYTDDGRKLLDFTCGIGVTNTGHCHPQTDVATH
jgi:4-aminobutyrate aminotransferase-like enzyme